MGLGQWAGKHPWLTFFGGLAVLGSAVEVFRIVRGPVAKSGLPLFQVGEAVTVNSSTGTFSGHVSAVNGFAPGPFSYDVVTDKGTLAAQPEANLKA